MKLNLGRGKMLILFKDKWRESIMSKFKEGKPTPSSRFSRAERRRKAAEKDAENLFREEGFSSNYSLLMDSSKKEKKTIRRLLGSS
ncbi:MAG: hypothetical protein GF381_03195 [Candidatus Pacebacteria bacterium]|nr:hypothetical protein [Candidatus Paceibacterota bacterium]